MIRLVFTADNHINKHYGRMTPDQLNHRRARLRDAWQTTVNFALEQGADVYLHGGDLFDSPNPRPADWLPVVRELKRLQRANIPVFMIGGNHDVPRSKTDGVTPQRIYGEIGLANVFTRVSAVEWETLDINGLRLAIGGLPFDPRLAAGEDPLADINGLLPPAGVDFAVLMLHYAIEGCLLPDVNEPIIPKQTIADLSDIDLVLVGHIHERRVMQIGDVTVAFSGPTERMSFGELGVKAGFVEALLNHDGVKVRHHNTPVQPMRRDVLRTTDLPTDNPTDALREHIKAQSDPQQIYQLRLEGPLAADMYKRMRWWEIERLGMDLNFYFDLDRRPAYLVQTDQLPVGTGGERVDPRQEIRAIAASMWNDTEDEQERALIDAARDTVLVRLGHEG